MLFKPPFKISDGVSNHLALSGELQVKVSLLLFRNKYGCPILMFYRFDLFLSTEETLIDKSFVILLYHILLFCLLL